MPPPTASSHSIGSTFAAQNSPRERKTFFDYFPNAYRKFPEYIRQDTFKNKMERIINEELSSIGTFKKWWKAPDYNDSYRISEMRNDAWQSYINCIKEGIRSRALQEEWLHLSDLTFTERDRLDKESDVHLKSAATDTAIALVSFGFGKGFSRLVKTEATTALKGAVKVETSSLRGVKVSRAVSAEVRISEKSKWARGIFGGKPEKPVAISLVGGSTTDIGITVGKEVYNGLKTQEDYEPVDVMDYSGFGMNKTANKGLSIGAGFVPFVAQAQTIDNIGANVIFGLIRKHEANELGEFQHKCWLATFDYRSKLRDTIYGDINNLNLDEIEDLIDLCGMGKLIE